MDELYKVLTPLADPKIVPQTRPVVAYKLERIPSLVDLTTGQFTSEFVEFFNRVCDAIASDNWIKLYTLSDKAVDEDRFKTEYYRKIHSTWRRYADAKDCHKKLDIELDAESTSVLTRNIYMKLNIVMYILAEELTDIHADTVIKFSTYATSLYFTYRNNQFQLMSIFEPFRRIEK